MDFLLTRDAGEEYGKRDKGREVSWDAGGGTDLRALLACSPARLGGWESCRVGPSSFYSGEQQTTNLHEHRLPFGCHVAELGPKRSVPRDRFTR